MQLAWYLQQHYAHMQVTLVIPWLCQAEQAAIFSEGQIFSAPYEQA